jgi:hypothetical protein
MDHTHLSSRFSRVNILEAAMSLTPLLKGNDMVKKMASDIIDSYLKR